MYYPRSINYLKVNYFYFSVRHLAKGVQADNSQLFLFCSKIFITKVACDFVGLYDCLLLKSKLFSNKFIQKYLWQLFSKLSFVVSIFYCIIVVLLLSESYLLNIAILLLISFISYSIPAAPICIIQPSYYFISAVNDLPSATILLYHRYLMSKLFIFLSVHYFYDFIIPLLNELFTLFMLELLVKFYYGNAGNLFNIVLIVQHILLMGGNSVVHFYAYFLVLISPNPYNIE